MSSASTTPSIAVVGSGYWGKNLTRNFYELGALHTVCDSDAEILEDTLAKYPGIKVCNDFQSILTDPDITGVAIATPAETHGHLVEQAILAAKDVYVEKPLCLSVDDAERLVRLAKQESRILMVGHLLWYHPALLKLKTLIDDGELGKIAYIYSNRLNLGKLRREENVLWSFAPHDISVILGLLEEEPDRVRAKGGNFLDDSISDTTMSLLDFKSGVKSHIFVSWLHPFKEQKLVVVGDKKMAVFTDTAPWPEKLSVYPHSIKWSHNIPIAQKADCEYISLQEAEPLKSECQHFLDCIDSRDIPRTDGAEALRVLKVLKACQSSLELDKEVQLKKRPSNQTYVHDTAIIDKQVTIGDNTRIWHFSHVLTNTTIGSDCTIGQNVMAGPNVSIGNACKIQNNVSVYDGVTLEDDVFLGPSMVFTNVSTPRATVNRQGDFLKTLVRKGATIGANATIVCGNNIGQYAFVGAGAVVTKDVPAHALVIGNPATQSGWMCECGEKLNEKLGCGHCQRSYTKTANGLVRR